MQMPIFSSADVDRIVFTRTRAGMVHDIEHSKKELNILSKDDIGARFYWEDRIKAFKLALEISEWLDPPLIIPEKPKQPIKNTPKVRGGVLIDEYP